MRSNSEPPVGKMLSGDGHSLAVGNPWYSEKAQLEHMIRARRLQGLPEQSPASEGVPIRDDGLHTGLCVGKGRGGQASSKLCFVTPPSKVSGSGRGGDEVGLGKRTEGRIPKESNSMGRLDSRDDAGLSMSDDSLQRALEREIVTHLREQNAHLLSELEMYRQQKSTPKSGDGSTQSWVEVHSREGGLSGNHGDGRGCNTPRKSGQSGKEDRFTPNGTKIPDGTPPRDDAPSAPDPPMLPPVPPFPTMADDAAVETLGLYDTTMDGSGGRMGDRSWKPQGSKPSELSPGEARAFWLEKEVNSLKQSLDRITSGNSFRNSEYWSKGFHPATGPPVFPSSRLLTEPVNFTVDPDAAERFSRAHPGDAPMHGCGEHRLHDRAGMSSSEGVDHRHLRGGSGDVSHQDRADNASNRKECPGNLLGGSGHPALQARAPHGGGDGNCPDARALHRDHGVCRDSRAWHLGHEVYPDDRAPMAPKLHPEDHQHSGLDRRHAGGGGMGMETIPTSWESGGGISSSKADLPELPANASPLQFGDWIHLCGPVMRDLSSVASRWWDLTVRQATDHYADWKTATPLQRVQIDPRVPDELHDRCYGRTEQRGVHLLLKAVAPEIQQMLVTDRQMTSTAILYRLYIRYQPGGPGEKSLILKELTQLPKTQSMAELATALRSWRRHYGRAREVGATLPDGILLLRALESGVQLVAKENSQAAFRLAQSRALLQVDEQPQPSSIWDFSQCILAEAETLVLMSSSLTLHAEAPPLKLKTMEVDNNQNKRPGQDQSSSGKGRGTTTSEVPCKWFRSEAGCRAGRQCKWSHAWDGVEDKSSRCWNCGSKSHRKQDCPVKGGGSKKLDETKVSGGGSASNGNKVGGTSTSASTTPSSMPSQHLLHLPRSQKSKKWPLPLLPHRHHRGRQRSPILVVMDWSLQKAWEMVELGVIKLPGMRRRRSCFTRQRSC